MKVVILCLEKLGRISDIGENHVAALRADGTVLAWGSNAAGQTNIPNTLSNVVSIACGGLFSLALKSDGTVVAWGTNDFGQLSIPAPMNVVAVSAGFSHGLALKADGTVAAWGDNRYGQTIALLSETPRVDHAALVALTGEPFRFVVPTQSGHVYLPQYTPDPASAIWTSLPLFPGSGYTVVFTNPMPREERRLFRILRW